MRVDRHAAAVIGHAQRAVGFEFHFNAIGKARDRFVHRVVEHFGEQVMQRALIDTADVHTWAFAHRFEAFENLDILCGVAIFRGRRWRIAFAEEAAFPEIIVVFGHRRFLLRLRHDGSLRRFALWQQWCG